MADDGVHAAYGLDLTVTICCPVCCRWSALCTFGRCVRAVVP